MSLMGNIWSATHKPKQTQTYSQFDQLMNTVSSETMITLLYGTRKWSGAQLYHKASADGTSLTKDILIGEGTIAGVYGVCANDILISTGPVLSLKNINYSDATVTLTSGNLRLYANSVVTNIPLVTTKDDITTFDYNVTIDKLIGHLGTLGNGWVVGEPVNCANGTTELIAVAETPCYNSATPLTVTGLTGCSYVFHDGSPSQAPPDNYATVGGYKNMAWLRVSLTYSSKLSSGGNPTITYVCRGMKVTDTRTGAYGSSSNSAMITRDLLLSKRFGAARFIPNIAELLDEESFKEVADYCDTQVNYKDSNGFTHSEARYATNIIVDTKKTLVEVLDDILASYGGFLVLSNGRIGLRIEAPCTSSYDFTNDTIVANSFVMDTLSIDETPNQYNIGYFDPTQNWTQVKCVVEDTVDQQPKPVGRGKVIPKELVLTGCTSQSQAIRQGRLQKLKNKLCFLVATWKTSTFAMALQPGDVVTTTYDKVDDNGELLRIIDKMPWRILEISQADGVYTIKGRQYNASIYGDVTEVIEVKDYTPVANPLSAVVPYVTNLATSQNYRALGDGTVTTDVRVSWSSADPFYESAEVYLLSNNPAWDEIDVSMDALDGSWEDLGTSTDTWVLLGKAVDNLYATNLIKGLTYTLKVVSVNSAGRKSTFNDSPEASIAIKGKTYTPNAPTGLTVSITDTCEWLWNQLDTDADFAELRLNGNTGETAGLLVKTSSTKALATPTSRTGQVLLYAHNTNGYYSAPATLEYNKALPVAPVVIVTKVFQGFVVTTNALPQYGTGINVHVGSSIFHSNNNEYTYATTGGVFNVSVAFTDIFGEGVLSETKEVIVVATIDPTLIAAESLSLAMMDTVMVDAVTKANAAATKLSVDDVESEVSNAKTRLSTVEGTVITQGTSISTLDTEIALKASKDIVDTLVGRVTTAESSIVTQGDAIALKAAQSTVDTLANTVSSNKSAVDISISGITQTVTANKTTQDGVNTGLVAQIDIQAGQITQVASDLQGANTVIAQNTNAIQLRATKDDLVAQINLSPETITIASKFNHVAGDTLFDDNVIIPRMLNANSVIAGKIDVDAVTAREIKVESLDAIWISVNSLDAVCATIGTLRTATTGERTEIKDNLIEVYDANDVLRVRMGVW